MPVCTVGVIAHRRFAASRGHDDGGRVQRAVFALLISLNLFCVCVFVGFFLYFDLDGENFEVSFGICKVFNQYFS